MQIFRQADLIETPWKNGGGVTRNIASRLDGDATLWRLSMADVSTGGPFSNFAGLTRVLTVIDGSGMILHGPDGDLKADFAVPVRFDGKTAIVAELTQGPLRDFNLMYDAKRCAGHAVIEKRPLQDATLGVDGGTAVLHCITGSISVEGQTLAAGDTVIDQETPLRYCLPQGAIALTITLTATS